MQKSPPKIIGPFLNLELAKNELQKVAFQNGGSRMMVEIIDDDLVMDPHYINGISQTPANGFEKWWGGWNDINSMIEIVKQNMTCVCKFQ